MVVTYFDEKQLKYYLSNFQMVLADKVSDSSRERADNVNFILQVEDLQCTAQDAIQHSHTKDIRMRISLFVALHFFNATRRIR